MNLCCRKAVLLNLDAAGGQIPAQHGELLLRQIHRREPDRAGGAAEPVLSRLCGD
jgi:hypothetical protein